MQIPKNIIQRSVSRKGSPQGGGGNITDYWNNLNNFHHNPILNSCDFFYNHANKIEGLESI
jgi:hypothetical protein